MMKKLALFFFGLIVSRATLAQLQDDGPYVWHTDSGITVHAIIGGQVVTNHVTGTAHVQFSNTPELDFSVPYKISYPAHEPSTFVAPAKILAISDIEGEFAAFRKLLIGNKVMDRNYRWVFGKGHLVICGDLFDRGKDVLPCLWLLYRLEGQAQQYGGYVHVILGNHDIMNLSGDYRYTDDKYLQTAKALRLPYARLFDAHTELGRWLRTKNIIEKIGNCLFLHGGVSPAVNSAMMQPEQINAACRPWYAAPQKQIPQNLQVFLGRSGLFWYRGYFMGARAIDATLDSTLKLFGVRQIIVGHTIIKNRVALYYNGKVLNIDVDQHNGHHSAALFVKGTWYATDEKGKRTKLIYQSQNDQIKPEDIL